MTILETPRLRLRTFTTNDTDFIIELVNSPGWIQFIGDRNIRTTEQARAYLENGPIKSYHQNGYGLCLVERKNDNTPIGMCGILKRDTLENPDIGFAFLPLFNGQGYAFEIANATLQHAKIELKISVVSAITMTENAKSIRLLEKLGFKFLKTITSPENEQLLLYENRTQY